MIITSAYRLDHPQANGLVPVIETHNDSSGEVYSFEYLANPSHDYQRTLDERAARINAELETKSLAVSESLNGILPITKLEFLARFTGAERIAVRTAAKTDGVIEDFMELLKITDVIHPNHPMAQQGLSYLVSLGILTTERAEVIGAA